MWQAPHAKNTRSGSAQRCSGFLFEYPWVLTTYTANFSDVRCFSELKMGDYVLAKHDCRLPDERAVPMPELDGFIYCEIATISLGVIGNAHVA
jgi:hypothetical protein